VTEAEARSGARGRGVAVRALRTATEWMFNELGLQRIELQHWVDNEASCRVAGRSGYPLEGTLRQRGLHADGWHDMLLHARVRGDPDPGG
jgi:RimJ/RimL family protein N-acetyltransferase